MEVANKLFLGHFSYRSHSNDEPLSGTFCIITAAATPDEALEAFYAKLERDADKVLGMERYSEVYLESIQSIPRNFKDTEIFNYTFTTHEYPPYVAVHDPDATHGIEHYGYNSGRPPKDECGPESVDITFYRHLA